LSYLPDINIWNKKNLTNIDDINKGCFSLISY